MRAAELHEWMKHSLLALRPYLSIWQAAQAFGMVEIACKLKPISDAILSGPYVVKLRCVDAT